MRSQDRDVPPAPARSRTEELLVRAALTVSSVYGDDVFTDLVRGLAGLLGTDIAFIALLEPENPSILRMLAFELDGEIRENFDYAISGTPCEQVVGRQYQVYPRDLNALFPRDTAFTQLGLESYAGYPLSGADGEPLGLMSVVSRRPIEDEALVESIVKIFAVRAAAALERVRANEALAESEASYRAIFDAAEDAIFIHDWDTGQILDANPKACAAYGWTREELRAIGIDSFSSGIPPYTARHAEYWLARARSGEHPRFEWHRRNRDGTLHWDEVVLKPATLGGKRRIIAFTREVTERKLAEEALRDSEAQYRTIFNASADALVLRDADFHIIDVNATYERMSGFRREEVLGVDRVLANPADVAGHLRDLHARALAGEVVQLETRLVRRDGLSRDLELRGVPVQHRGTPHVLWVGRDITDRRRVEDERLRLETQLRQAQKMEALGHLTGGIAHDFNNILTGVLGYIVLALERAEDSDPKLSGYLAEAQKSCRRARDLIQQMLTFSRGQRGERRPLAVPAFVDEATSLIRSVLPSSAELAVESDAHGTIVADPVQVEQVLLNLCINARDAMNGRGRLLLAVRNHEHVSEACTSCRKPFAGEFVEIRVQDEGPGIAPEVVERIFEPFFSTKEVGRGSGMGLAVVHGIVHEHGGHVLVESRPGEGAVFRVFLPAHAAEVAARGEAESKPGWRRPALHGRVLVVDDEASVAAFMTELLQTWGLDAKGVRSGADALALLERDATPFSLVITDQMMPGMTGLQLAAALRDRFPDLPVVLYTGFVDGVSDDEIRAAGLCARVRKPVEPAELRRCVEDCLGVSARATT